MKTPALRTAACLALVTATPACFADAAPANTVQVGLYYIHFDVNAQDVSGPYVPPGVNLDVKDIETPYFAFERRVSNHFSVDLDIGYPPVAKAEGKGPKALGSVPYNGQVLITTRALAPTLMVKYAFFDESRDWRPYLGAGINYARFFDRRTTGAGEAALGGPTSISLPASLGPAVTAGMHYRLQGRWSIDMSYSLSKINSRLTADTAGFLRTTHIEFNPGALVLAVGYSF